jgi:type I restriction enzyme S subunit
MSFPRYPAYKDSGVEWLGEVPEHWTIIQSRRMFRARREAAREGDVMLTASQKYGMIPQAEFVEREGRRVVEVIHGKDNLIHVEPDDFVISMRSFQGGLEWCHHSGSTSFHYVPVTPIKFVVPAFFANLLKSERYISALRSTTNLIRDGQEIRYSNFVQVPLPVIPESEQLAIATFLDRETAKIDALIAEQQRLIELLQEKRQAVISHAVTKGLNPDAPMKDSGVEWLGEVPEHWIVTQLRHFTKSLPGFAFSSEGFIQDESKWKLLRGVNVGVSCIRWDDTLYWDRQVDDRLDQYVLSPGDLVVGLDRPMIKEGLRVARIAQEDCPCMLLQRVAAVKDSKDLSNDYLFFLLSSPYFLAHFEPETTGVSVPHISTGQIDSFVVPIPPPKEQAEVVAFLSVELKAIQRLTEESSRSISLLQERRSALISAAVTGQIDVRGLVAEVNAD